MNSKTPIDNMEAGDMTQEVLILDDGIRLQELGESVRRMNYTVNIDLVENIPSITEEVSCLDVVDALNSPPLNDIQLKDSLAALCIMVNRLLAENRYLHKEIQALKTNYTQEGVNRFNNLVFRKRNIQKTYYYHGNNLIDACNLNELIKNFDLNATRKNESAIATLRRFIKFLLEKIIPTNLHSKFTLRERCGVESLIELPLDLVNIIREICLESVNMHDPSTEEDKERTEDLGIYLIGFIKYALQEMRRNPRRSAKQIKNAKTKKPEKD